LNFAELAVQIYQSEDGSAHRQGGARGIRDAHQLVAAAVAEGMVPAL
jgi:hypothetical protein